MTSVAQIIRAYFVVAGFTCAPDTITNALNISPDDFGEKGKLRKRQAGGGQYRIVDSFWKLNSSALESYNIEDYVEDIIVQIQPSFSYLRELLSTFDVDTVCNLVIAISIHPNASIPGMTLNPSALRFLGNNNINLIIDIN